MLELVGSFRHFHYVGFWLESDLKSWTGFVFDFLKFICLILESLKQARKNTESYSTSQLNMG